MSLLYVLIWGFAATVVLTTIMAGSQYLKLTRMNIPYLLGTMVTPDRDKAKLIGIGIHLINGWIFAFVYFAAMMTWDGGTWWKGMLIGLVHSAFVLLVAMPLMPGMHPRMNSADGHGKDGGTLEPPGVMGLHYGWPTPASIILAHLVYGLILGTFYG